MIALMATENPEPFVMTRNLVIKSLLTLTIILRNNCIEYFIPFSCQRSQTRLNKLANYTYSPK
jgi:hypothetical protein